MAKQVFFSKMVAKQLKSASYSYFWIGKSNAKNKKACGI